MYLLGCVEHMIGLTYASVVCSPLAIRKEDEFHPLCTKGDTLLYPNTQGLLKKYFKDGEDLV